MNHEGSFVILESFIFHSFEGIHWNIFCWDHKLCPPSLMVSVISHKKSVWFYFKHMYCPVLLNFVSLQGFLVKGSHICYICVTVAFCPSSFFPRIGGQQPVHERSTPTFHTYLPIHRLSSFSVPHGSVFINSPWILARVGQIQHWLAVLFPDESVDCTSQSVFSQDHLQSSLLFTTCYSFSVVQQNIWQCFFPLDCMPETL